MVAAPAIPSPREVANDPVLFAAKLLWILDIKKRKRRLLYNDEQLHYLQHRTRRDLILKERHVGFTTLVQSDFFRLVSTRTCTTGTLAHEDKASQRLRRMADRFYHFLPPDFRPRRKYANASITTYPGFQSEAEIDTAGNPNAGRSATYTHIHGSECAFWKDADAIIASMLQAGDPEYVVFESTPNGAQGWFYNASMEALDDAERSPEDRKSIWKLHFYPWYINPSRVMPLDEGEIIEYTDDEAALVEKHKLTPEQIKWRRAKQRELKHLFPQEYPEHPRNCFLLSGKGYFGDITSALTALLNAEYTPGATFVAGLDFGQVDDWLVLSIGRLDTRQQVDILRVNRLPWAEMRRQIIEKCKKWHVKRLVAEANAMGSTNIEALRSEMSAAGCDTQVDALTMTPQNKPLLVGGLHEALHNGGLKLLPDENQKREFEAFTASQTKTGHWRYEARTGEHDDMVIAAALMYYVMAVGVGAWDGEAA